MHCNFYLISFKILVVCNRSRDILNHLSFASLPLCSCSLLYHCLLWNCITILRCFCFMMMMMKMMMMMMMMMMIGKIFLYFKKQIKASTIFPFNMVAIKMQFFSFRIYRVWKTKIFKREFCNYFHHIFL